MSKKYWMDYEEPDLVDEIRSMVSFLEELPDEIHSKVEDALDEVQQFYREREWT